MREKVSSPTVKSRNGKSYYEIHPTTEDLLKVMEKEPWLCAWGLANEGLCKRMRRQGFVDCEQSREELKNKVRMFQLCCEWLSLCRVRRTVNLSIGTSYSLKHAVEKWCGEYIANGAFIAAVIHLGISYKSYNDSPNIHVGLS